MLIAVGSFPLLSCTVRCATLLEFMFRLEKEINNAFSNPFFKHY